MARRGGTGVRALRLLQSTIMSSLLAAGCFVHTRGEQPSPPDETVAGQSNEPAAEARAPAAASPGAASTPQVPDFGEEAARDGAVADLPDVRRELADADLGGLRESLSDVPSIVGDGGPPSGTGGKSSIDRLVIVGSGMTLTGSTLHGSTPAVVYDFPQNYRDIQNLPTNPPGVVPGAIPVGIVPGQPAFNVSGVPPGGASTIVSPSGSYAANVDAALQQQFISRTGAADGVATFTPSTSGALANGGSYDAFGYYNYVVNTDSTTPGLNVGFIKLAENVSPLPRDRVFFNYSYFKNSYFGQGIRGDVNRFMPGFEKTFYDGWTSIEFRTPFAATLSSVQGYDSTAGAGITNNRAVTLGDMSVIFKTVIERSTTWALTGGMQVMCPTASDVRITSVGAATAIAPGSNLVLVENESVHTMPFVGFLWAPNSRLFTQSLLQVDVDVNGNPAYANVLLTDNIKQAGNYAGRLTYPTFMYIGLSAGYWVYKNNDPSARLTGISPIMELHVNQSLSPYDVIRKPGFQLGEDPGSVSIINGMVGFNIECGTRSTMTFAYVSPIGGGVDRWFDGEARALYNWRFGPQSRLTRIQF